MSEQPYAVADPASNDTSSDGVGSIVDSILDLDELLSADVRRAQKIVRICTKPWLEAELDSLAAELDSLTDERGEPLTRPEDEAMASAGRTAYVVAEEYRTVQRQYADAMRSVVLEQMPEPQWRAWEKVNNKKLEDGEPEVFNELIVKCAVKPTFTVDQLAKLRDRLGHAQVDALAMGAWAVNTKSGVSIPKSPLVSHVLRRQERARS